MRPETRTCGNLPDCRSKTGGCWSGLTAATRGSLLYFPYCTDRIYSPVVIEDGEQATGGLTTVVRIGETIRPPTGVWTPGSTEISSNPRAGDGPGNLNPDFAEIYLLDL